MNFLDLFAQKLREKREQKKITQRELAVGVFLVQRIAALSVKHNMSSVSVLGGW